MPFGNTCPELLGTIVIDRAVAGIVTASCFLSKAPVVGDWALKNIFCVPLAPGGTVTTALTCRLLPAAITLVLVIVVPPVFLNVTVHPAGRAVVAAASAHAVRS